MCRPEKDQKMVAQYGDIYGFPPAGTINRQVMSRRRAKSIDDAERPSQVLGTFVNYELHPRSDAYQKRMLQVLCLTILPAPTAIWLTSA